MSESYIGLAPIQINENTILEKIEALIKKEKQI